MDNQVMQKISINLEVYTYHIDFAGHVSNIVYIQWMEIARIKLLAAIGLPTHEIAKAGFIPVLLNTEISYKKPLYLGDRVQVDLWLEELKQASAIMGFHMTNQVGELAAVGRQKGIFLDTATQRPMRLTSAQRELFLPYLQAADPNAATA
jgi:acyl-CoA thioester hydrolase